jgi:ABC-type transport system involved in Fe-S cluster assembly fused permease/ATPase subunit
MSEWLAEYKRTQKYMIIAARLEGVVEAHKILKAGNGDVYDELLWRMTDEIIVEGRDDA